MLENKKQEKINQEKPNLQEQSGNKPKKKPRVIIANNQTPSTGIIKAAKFTYQVGDIIKMKKQHPCGCSEWKVMRTGADMKLKCEGCGHEMMMSRILVQKSTKQVLP